MRLSSAQPRSVIILLNHRDSPRISGVMQDAQTRAAQAGLPCAVVATYEFNTTPSQGYFRELEELEHQLAFANMPLILMFGSRATILKTLHKHFEPDIYESDSSVGILSRHPLKWPWPVQSVATLHQYVDRVGISGVCEL